MGIKIKKIAVNFCTCNKQEAQSEIEKQVQEYRVKKIKRKVISCFPELMQPKPIPLDRVISNGNIGPALAALETAKKFRIDTSGHMPTGYLTLAGPRPKYRWMYNCTDDVENWRESIWLNVSEADATIRLALNFATEQEYFCLDALQKMNKLHLDIYMQPFWRIPGDSGYCEQERITPAELAQWIIDNNVKVLNVTGGPNIALHIKVFSFLVETFDKIMWREGE